MKDNVIHFLENILLIVLTAFLFVVPFDKHAVRILLCIGLIAIILLSILKYKSKFYRALIPNVSVFKFLFLFLSLPLFPLYLVLTHITASKSSFSVICRI